MQAYILSSKNVPLNMFLIVCLYTYNYVHLVISISSKYRPINFDYTLLLMKKLIIIIEETYFYHWKNLL